MKLKEFQRATVDRAVKGLTRGSRRFLVADEVGLGKTLVARGVIDRLTKASGGHVEIFYVCSSLSIAHQNRDSLLELLDPEHREAARVEVDRLTLLPTRPPARSGRFTLFTLTPNTMPGDRGHRAGRADERAVLWCLFDEFLDGFSRQRGLRDALPRGVKSWSRYVDSAHEALGGTSRGARKGLWYRFRSELTRALKLRRGNSDRELVDELRGWVRSDEDQKELISTLRFALSVAALRNLRPSLVILDEFQRFFGDVAGTPEEEDDGEAEATDLMQLILNPTGKEHSPSVLMLSATPYRQFAGWSDGGSSHADELFRLLRFLYGRGSANEVEHVKKDFEQYARLLRTAAPGDEETLAVRDRLQARLTRVIARTEREGLLGEPARTSRPVVREASLDPTDVAVFRHLCESAQDEHRGMAEPLWSSIPFPLQMMDDNYVLRRDAEPTRVRASKAVVRRSRVRRYERLATPHPRLRELWNDVDWTAMQLPWMPPTRPWWPLGGAFRQGDSEPPSKRLIFSRFRAAPRAIASALSFEVERRSLAGGKMDYDYFARGRKSLVDDLRTTSTLRPQPRRSFDYSRGSDGEGQALLIVATFFPLPGLARLADPLRLLVKHPKGLTLEKAIKDITAKLERALPLTTEPSKAPWYASIGAAEQALGTFQELADGWNAWLAVRQRESNETQLAEQFLADAQRQARTPIPARHLEDLARHALLGPANLCLRAAERVFGKAASPAARLHHIIDVSSGGFRPYLDTPEFHGLFAKSDGHRLAVLRAVWDGNLEATLDEYFITIQGLGAEAPNAEREVRAFDDLGTALGIRDSSVTVKSLNDRDSDFHLRCHAALPFGMSPKEVVAEKTGKLRNDFLRVAFNSPFRPFVLVTTSLGQEGLDFHVYCDHLVHWDLPTNPVDIEQREGRISRYGGLGVRRVLAADAPALVPDRSPWHDIAKLQTSSAGGLAPWWCAPGSTIRRTVYVAPLSKVEHDLDELLAALSLYRLTLGQADQEHLLRALKRRLETSEDPTALRNWLETARIDLSPFSIKSKGAVAR